MADIDFLKRQYYVSALGLTEAQAARMTINDLEYEFFSTALPTINGTGSPEGVVTAPVGTYYTDTAGTNGAWRWLKKTGSGNTGWSVIDGDTGVRTVMAQCVPAEPNIMMTSAKVHRSGNTVVFDAEFTSGATAPASPFTLYILPVGFRPSQGKYGMLQPYENGSHACVYNSGSLNIYWIGANNLGSRWRGVWHTTDAWPTSLP